MQKSGDDRRATAAAAAEWAKGMEHDDVEDAIDFLARRAAQAAADPAPVTDAIMVDLARYRAQRMRERLLRIVNGLLAAIERRDLDRVVALLDDPEAYRPAHSRTRTRGRDRRRAAPRRLAPRAHSTVPLSVPAVPAQRRAAGCALVDPAQSALMFTSAPPPGRCAKTPGRASSLSPIVLYESVARLGQPTSPRSWSSHIPSLKTARRGGRATSRARRGGPRRPRPVLLATDLIRDADRLDQTAMAGSSRARRSASRTASARRVRPRSTAPCCSSSR